MASNSSPAVRWAEWKRSAKLEAESRGLWGEFVRSRTGHARKGLSVVDSWLGAAREVLPEWYESHPVKSWDIETRQRRHERTVKEIRETVEAAADLGEFERAEASNRVVIQWVADALGRGVGGRKFLCPTAKALYEWCMESGLNKASFWSSMFSRLLPTRAQIDKEDRDVGDGDGDVDESLRLLDEAIGG